MSWLTGTTFQLTNQDGTTHRLHTRAFVHEVLRGGRHSAPGDVFPRPVGQGGGVHLLFTSRGGRLRPVGQEDDLPQIFWRGSLALLSLVCERHLAPWATLGTEPAKA